MTVTARAAWISVWLVAIGLAAVWLEVENVRAGVRLRDLMLERDARTERFRRLEIRFNRMVSPDLLQKGLPPELRPPGSTEPAEKAPAPSP
jgi:hypothetical protein